MVDASPEVQREEARAHRAEQLREEALDAGAYKDALEAAGFTRKEVLELVMHWQGWRWDDGAP